MEQAKRIELGPLNRAVRVLLDELNDRPMKKLGVSRRALYERLDRPARRPLPATRYVLAHWKLCRVNIFCGARQSASGQAHPAKSRICGASLGQFANRPSPAAAAAWRMSHSLSGQGGSARLAPGISA